ncbi:MAG: class II D-tagatose-bisphosphate aldolase, non-catalytic subunit [Anaerolineales bacterium]|nr:class II D-tagatose-bisphosphate aldolase, non-catalytic subunit [Anaerolineales bacterium]MDW8161533.1 class II D-tagatose-bisphosphate aldolase, non-catalytic subunit [Anaerolineales bacterium]
MFLDEIVAAQHREIALGIPSICSSHPWVLRTALRAYAPLDKPLLIESTCNQVNQEGGYTGMTPAEFVAYLGSLADQEDFPKERLLIGGDHLGPYPWRREGAERAMEKAQELVRASVQAGYQKIHLDASMPLGDDDLTQPLPLEIIAERTAQLALAAVQAAPDQESLNRLRFVIGSEVPPPGGAPVAETGIAVTEVANLQESFSAVQSAFRRAGLAALLDQVVALVVQPGVEFGDDFIFSYQPQNTRSLVRWIEAQPSLVFEAHSTDYQTRENLRKMVSDHFAILKVGPALTFAFREAVFALAHIEEHLCSTEEQSHLFQVLERAMLENPTHWQSYYGGTPAEQALKRKFSLSDRIRYYWSDPSVQAALAKLLHNLHGRAIPPGLLRQYLPQAEDWASLLRTPQWPQQVIMRAIRSVLDDYLAACWGV